MFDGIYCYEEDESPLPKGAALSPVEFGTSGYVPADQAEMEHLDLDGIGEELNDEDTAADQQSEPTTPAVITTTTLKEVHENQTCFDCKCDSPQWVNVSYTVFLCGSCANIHAEFGLVVKPISDQCLSARELGLLWRTGNKAAHDYWLATWNASNAEYLSSSATKDIRTKYIIEKYRGKWLKREERHKLSSVQHAFSSQPAYYGPASAPNLPAIPSGHYYDSIITQTQQLSIHTTSTYAQENPQSASHLLNMANSDKNNGRESNVPNFVMQNTGLYKRSKKHRKSN